MKVPKVVSSEVTTQSQDFERDKVPDVSVIIAAYNTEAFVEKAISSALNQIDVSVEVIVVDDASPDNTANIVAAIDDPRLTLIRHVKNQWAGTARNNGINQARGNWLAILDSDDEFELNRLATLKDLAERTNSQVVCDNQMLCDLATGATQTMFPVALLESLESLTLIDFIEGNLGARNGYTLGYLKPFMQRAFLNRHNIRYPTNMNLGEDYFILADLLAAGADCRVEPKPYYRYLVRKGSMSHQLEVWDTDNILREGAAFVKRHIFDDSVLPVLKKRNSFVKHNRAFLRAIEAVKNRELFKLLRILLGHPRVIGRLLVSAINRNK